MLAVRGGKGGVGVTTIAVNLAIGFGRRALRTLLVDADPRGGDVAHQCGIESEGSLDDVLRGRRTLLEVIQHGPEDIAVVPAAWASDYLADSSPSLPTRLVEATFPLQQLFDIVVIDSGCGAGRAQHDLSVVADDLLLVTSDDDPSAAGTYAAIKQTHNHGRNAPVYLIVNRASNRRRARSLQQRLTYTCHRCLGIGPEPLDPIPADRHIARSGRTGRPFLAGTRRGSTVKALESAVDALLAANRNRPEAEPPGQQPGNPVKPPASKTTLENIRPALRHRTA